MNRRSLLKVLLTSSTGLLTTVLSPIKALAKWNEAAFTAESIKTALLEYYPDKEIIPSDKIAITVRPEVENGAVVPIKINTALPEVESIAIFVKDNPNPLIANFDLSPQCKGFVSTRIKMDGPSDVMAVVVSKGQPYSSSKHVIVHAGGCG